jgi:hypothetical protein
MSKMTISPILGLGCGSVVECSPSICETLGLICSIAKRNKNVMQK